MVWKVKPSCFVDEPTFCCVTFLSNCRVAKIGIVAIQSVQFRHDDFACITVVVDNGGVAVCVVVIITCNHISFVTVRNSFRLLLSGSFSGFGSSPFLAAEDDFTLSVQRAVIVGCYDSCKKHVSAHNRIRPYRSAGWFRYHGKQNPYSKLYVFSHSPRYNVKLLPQCDHKIHFQTYQS